MQPFGPDHDRNDVRLDPFMGREIFKKKPDGMAGREYHCRYEHGTVAADIYHPGRAAEVVSAVPPLDPDPVADWGITRFRTSLYLRLKRRGKSTGS